MVLKTESKAFSLTSLFDPFSVENSTQRKKVAEIASLVQMVSGVGIGVSVFQVVGALCRLSPLPVVAGVVSALVLRDVCIAAKNTHNLMTDYWFGRSIKIGNGDPATVVHFVAKNTLFIEPVFGSMFISLLIRWK